MLFVCLHIVALDKASAQDIGEGFYCHGIAAPVSSDRGVVTTVDRTGENIVLVWLMDHRGGYALLKIDAQTGKTEEFATPFSFCKTEAPFASILSSRNRYYTHFGSYFLEFDVDQSRFTIVQKTMSQTAMSMTEDDNGVIWSVTYPDSGLVSYDPILNEFQDYGSIYSQQWKQYPRRIAADDKGWIYFAVGKTAAQVVAFDPESKTGMPMIPESERKHLLPNLYRDLDGKVYANWEQGFPADSCYELYEGRKNLIGRQVIKHEKKIIAGTQSYQNNKFPDGTVLKKIDLIEHQLILKKDNRLIRQLDFEYSSYGAHIMSVAASPDGIIYGGTNFPFCFFQYSPQEDQLNYKRCYGQWNTLSLKGQQVFIGLYPKGRLMEWNPADTWVPTEENNPKSNPKLICDAFSIINRPHTLLAHMDGKTIVMGATPDYGLTGGGILLWNNDSKKAQLLPHSVVIPDQSTRSLVSLNQRHILGGTTVSSGTGGVKKAKEAELYLMDVESKKLLWKKNLIPKVKEYSDLCLSDSGMVYGIADRKWFFVFDSVGKILVRKERLPNRISRQQGQRNLIKGSKDVYILYSKGIVKIEPEGYKITKLAKSPVPITAGGVFLDGRIYFSSGAKLYSYEIKN